MVQEFLEMFFVKVIKMIEFLYFRKEKFYEFNLYRLILHCVKITEKKSIDFNEQLVANEIHMSNRRFAIGAL